MTFHSVDEKRRLFKYLPGFFLNYRRVLTPPVVSFFLSLHTIKTEPKHAADEIEPQRVTGCSDSYRPSVNVLGWHSCELRFRSNNNDHMTSGKVTAFSYSL